MSDATGLRAETGSKGNPVGLPASLLGAVLLIRLPIVLWLGDP